MSDATERRQGEVLRLLAQPFHNGTATEGELVYYLWPLVRRPRRTIRAMEAKGLVRIGAYVDEEWGYKVHLTRAQGDEREDKTA